MPIQNIKFGRISIFSARCPWSLLGYSFVNDSWFLYFSFRILFFEIGVEYNKNRIQKEKERFLSRKDLTLF
jgi:hypothetical protein